MEKYIPKDKLVAEIEKRISEYENCGIDDTSINAKIIALQSLLIYIITLEMKESLAWQDIRLISEIGEKFMNSEESNHLSEEEYYTEILNRFKSQKGE